MALHGDYESDGKCGDSELKLNELRLTEIEQLQFDILGPRYKDKRLLLEFEWRAPWNMQIAWVGILIPPSLQWEIKL